MTDLVVQLVSEEEGRRAHVYADSTPQGYATIGVGCCVDSRVPGTGLCDAAIDVQLSYDLLKARKIAAGIPGYFQCNDIRQAVLTGMVFQLGALVGWPKFRAAIAAGDYRAAAAEGLSSKWAQQTPVRAKREMLMMADGLWHEHVK